MRSFRYWVDGEKREVRVEESGDGFRVAIGDAVYRLRGRFVGPHRLQMEIDGRVVHATVAGDARAGYIAVEGATWTLPYADRRDRSAAAGVDAVEHEVRAAMPGRVLDVLVSAGDTVASGQPLVLLEAMKMELRIAAPHPGRIARLHCAPGDVVERGRILVEFEAAATT